MLTATEYKTNRIEIGERERQLGFENQFERCPCGKYAWTVLSSQDARLTGWVQGPCCLRCLDASLEVAKAWNPPQ